MGNWGMYRGKSDELKNLKQFTLRILRMTVKNLSGLLYFLTLISAASNAHVLIVRQNQTVTPVPDLVNVITVHSDSWYWSVFYPNDFYNIWRPGCRVIIGNKKLCLFWWLAVAGVDVKVETRIRCVCDGGTVLLSLSDCCALCSPLESIFLT